MPTPFFTDCLETALGTLRVTCVDRGISHIEFVELATSNSENAPAALRQCLEQLQQYLTGDRTAFHSLPLAIRGTDFQCRVWDAASEVGYGETATYGDIAKELKTEGSQAVGQALGRNGLCLIIPCHRIVPAGYESDASEAQVGGYAWGDWRKKWLLDHEKSVAMR